ncbi:MAG: T9SS type A sorting domain-containing protein [Bacteroidota bacterium]
MFSENSKIKSSLIAFLFSLISYGQFSFPDTAWIYTYGGAGMDEGRDIQYTSDGGFIIAGTTNFYGSGNTAIYLIKVDSNCTHQWSKAIGGIGIEWGFSVKQTFDKGFVVAGYTNSFGYGGYDMYLVKTDSAGNILWEKTYGGTNWDFAYCVQQTSDSGFVLCGSTFSFGNGNEDSYIVKTNKNGDTLWTRTTGGDSTDIAYSIIIYNDSTYLFTGETNSFGKGSSDVYFGTINKQGTFSTHTFGTTKSDKGYCIEKTFDNNVVIFGETDSIPAPTITGKNELLLKLNAQGMLQWTQILGSAGEDIGRAVKEKTNGDLLTCGSINPSGMGGSGLHIQMLNSGGWWKSGPAFGGSGDEKGYALIITPKKEVAFIGSTTSYGQGMQDVYLIKMKSDSIVMDYSLVINKFKDTTLSPLGIQEHISNSFVQIYPNPFHESAILQITNPQITDYELKIYDLYGREVMTDFIRNADKFIIYKKNLSSGLYFFTVSYENSVLSIGKFITY